jgi:phosphopantothenoylcysteine decarboxylase/phosphopantothenate--cysteine ligase
MSTSSRRSANATREATLFVEPAQVEKHLIVRSKLLQLLGRARNDAIGGSHVLQWAEPEHGDLRWREPPRATDKVGTRNLPIGTPNSERDIARAIPGNRDPDAASGAVSVSGYHRVPAFEGTRLPFEPSQQYVRHPFATAITTAGRVLFTRPGGVVKQCATADPEAASELWEALATPIRGRDLFSRPGLEAGSVSALMEFLLEHQIVIPWTLGHAEPTDSRPIVEGPARPCRHLVLGITGAVQAVFAPHIIRRLAADFAERLDVVLTESAQKFLQPKALSVLGVSVWCDPFEPPEPGRVIHIELATRTELVLVYPATADVIFRLAHGACSDLLSLIVCATQAPVVVVPSMNPAMWRHPPTQRNVRMLREDGVFIVEPGPARSAASGADHDTGGPGLGPDAANLIRSLETILGLNR